MTPLELAALTRTVLWSAFLLAAIFGALVQRTGFCTMGAVTDAVALGSWTRMRQWALATAVAIIGFAVLVALGWLSAEQTLYASTRWLWLSALVGGGLFGFGMVLSSGCMSKTLVRAGAGNLKAVVVAIVTAVTGFATLKGITAVLRAASVDQVAIDFGFNADLGTVAGRVLGIGAPGGTLVIAGAAGFALLAWALWDREARQPELLLGGLGVGAVVVGMWWLTGHFAHLPEHPQTLQESWLATNSTRAEALSFVAPSAYALDWLLFFSDSNKHLTVGIVSVAGVIAGSAVVAVLRGHFRWEGFGGTSDLAHHLVGAVLMGIGGVTAMGCSIGQGVSGVSTLALTSVTALAAMLAGAAAAVKYQVRRLERLA